LYRHWGFYFTASTDPDKIGSRDLEQVLNDLKAPGVLTALNRENSEVAVLTKEDIATVHANEDIASQRLLRVLYARMIILRVFLESATKLHGAVTEVHKGRWLLLQVVPKVLLNMFDVFVQTAEYFKYADTSRLKNEIRELRSHFYHRYKMKTEEMVCVVDEAQHPAQYLRDYFCSRNHPNAPRPLLSQIVCSYADMFPIIVSGTGISMKEMSDVVNSSVSKFQADYRYTNIGAFGDGLDQESYVAQYLPAGFLGTKSGKLLVTRMAYWLSGR
jgi:hypothetical protein